MSAKDYMINLMADIIGFDETYKGDRLNDEDVWHQFITRVLERMETIEDRDVHDALNGIDRLAFQAWIDDPRFWEAVEAEIARKVQLLKTLLPSANDGHC